jgi:hypothetical protein
MASYNVVGYYLGSVSAGRFTVDAGYVAASYFFFDGDAGDTEFTVGEYISGSTQYVGKTAEGDIVAESGGFHYLWVAPGGNAGRSVGGQVDYSGEALTVCFLRGTLILTSRGDVPVERLRAGDLVATKFGGLRPIRWIGTQSFDGRFAGRATAPIRFARGSLGGGMPSCDLFVSPGHAILVGDVLAHAGALVNGETITQEKVRGAIEYFHLDLGLHDCVLANGAWAESYFEDRNRDSFYNAAEFHALHPGHEPERQATCLPIMTAEHPCIAAVRALLPQPLREAA